MTDPAPPAAGPPPPQEGDQSEVFAFLADPCAHCGVGPVKRIDTQSAAVFLAGDDAYKAPRAIRLPFLDFSTLDKRRAACEAEIAANRDNAPGVYLGVTPIVRRSGALAIGGEGEVVEWTTHMRRFDENATLDRVAERGELSPDLIRRLAAAIRRSHDRAPLGDGERATWSLATYLDQNQAAFAARPDLFAPQRAAALGRESRAAFAALEPLLLARGEAGRVRRCHGDLHLRNIALIDGEPTLFDAIAFDPDIATGDILYDLAFALMDLWERDLSAAANLLLASYLSLGEADELDGLAALPLFMSLRAAIRAKVEAANVAHLAGVARRAERTLARRYFILAEAFLRPAPPRLAAIGGLSGTGKSALAAALAPEVGRAPGALTLRSDVERKRLFAFAETERLPPAGYDLAATEATYARLLDKARRALAAGQGVILDAVYAKADERRAAARLAAELAAPFIGLWLEAPLATRLERIGRRVGDASDADAGIATRQSTETLAEPGWMRLEASGGLAATVTAARRKLKRSNSWLRPGDLL
jgi:aminoglycoside phosphotransferase family enzyme/cytidylate kinase